MTWETDPFPDVFEVVFSNLTNSDKVGRSGAELVSSQTLFGEQECNTALFCFGC